MGYGLSFLFHAFLGILLYFANIAPEESPKLVKNSSIVHLIESDKPDVRKKILSRVKVGSLRGLNRKTPLGKNRKGSGKGSRKAISGKLSLPPSSKFHERKGGGLEHLNPKLLGTKGLVQRFKQRGQQGVPGVSDSLGASWGEGAGSFVRIRDYLAYEKIQNTLKYLIHYPERLKRERIGGFVNARLALNSEGRCDWRQSWVRSSNIKLRIYALTVMKDFCKTTFWHTASVNRERSNLDLSFYFNLRSFEKMKSRVQGNVVFVEIPGHTRKTEWRLGPIQGDFLVPGLHIDFVWVRENWEKLMNSKNPMKTLKKYRKQGRKNSAGH